uniref:Uncharacterized protein n=1 Tax=Siphoviridae sp. ct0uL16 TaxID=2825299 RepID=A0A8S5Q5Z0_9CAUD|nr:MAG TPA: hypothetical protein [Siphoviridae sp. ct0uL16]
MGCLNINTFPSVCQPIFGKNLFFFVKIIAFLGTVWYYIAKGGCYNAQQIQ